VQEHKEVQIHRQILEASHPHVMDEVTVVADQEKQGVLL
jgi:hypothetical protein